MVVSFKISFKWTIPICIVVLNMKLHNDSAGWNFCIIVKLKFLKLYMLTYSNTSLTNLSGSSSDVYYILNICPNLGKNLLNDFSELVLVSFQKSIVIVEVLSWLKIVLEQAMTCYGIYNWKRQEILSTETFCNLKQKKRLEMFN